MTTRTTSASTVRRIAFTETSFDSGTGAAVAVSGTDAFTGGGFVPFVGAAGTWSWAAAGRSITGGVVTSAGDGFAVWVFSQATCSGTCFARRLDGYPEARSWNRRSAVVRSRDS